MVEIKEFKRCEKCLMPNTRPRITFSKDGVCNACNYFEAKKKIDWNKRKQYLKDLCDKYRRNDGRFDVIVPVSGGKNSSYVAWKMREEYGMHPLCVNIRSPLQTVVGNENLWAFTEAGFSLIEITPDPVVGKAIDKTGLVEYGQGQMAWLFAMTTSPVRIAMQMDIPLIMYGEEGESEYGGSRTCENKSEFNMVDVVNFYHSKLDAVKMASDKFSKERLFWYMIPDVSKFKGVVCHFSHFEEWDEYKHEALAVEKCGMKSASENAPGTVKNSWHLAEEVLYCLHMHLAFLKFGFGRATSDACIDIRMGKISREDALKIVEEKDGEFPEKYLDLYLDYYGMSEDEFRKAVMRWKR